MSGIDLDGTVVAVTGASVGLGRSMSLALAKAGARVVLAAPETDLLEAVAAEIDANPATSRSLCAARHGSVTDSSPADAKACTHSRTIRRTSSTLPATTVVCWRVPRSDDSVIRARNPPAPSCSTQTRRTSTPVRST